MSISAILRVFLAAFLLFIVNAQVSASGFNEGAKKCSECHEQEFDVWKNSPHFTSYKKIHKSKDAKKILSALGEKSMKRSEICVSCHYTEIQKSASAKKKVKSGPSCESCHGASSNWRDIHNDFGGPKVKSTDETTAHKAKRLADSEAKGMIASRMSYRVSRRCMDCHGLANPMLDAGIMAKMLNAGHPIEADFEVVKYSQGKIRHRFVPPNVNTNSKLDNAGTAQLYLGGQAAALVAASAVKGKVNDAKFNAAQDKRIQTARKALTAVKGTVPAAAKLLASPSEANALAFEAAIQGKDLSSKVAALLPKAASYK